MIKTTKRINLKNWINGKEINVIQVIKNRLTELSIPVTEISENSLEYITKSISFAVGQYPRVMNLFNRVVFKYDPITCDLEYTLDFTKLIMITIFTDALSTLFLSLVVGMQYGPINGLIAGGIFGSIFAAFIYTGNYFYSIMTFNSFIKKAVTNQPVLIKF